MKKPILIALTAFLLLFSACSMKEVIDPVTGELNNGVKNTSGNTGTNSGDSSAVSSANSYQPTSDGSTWVYDNKVIGGGTTQVTIKMTGGTTIFGGKTYYNASSTSPGQLPSNGYFYNDSNIYIVRSTSPAVPGLVINMQYLDTRLKVGETWSNPATDNGSINGIPAKMVGTIMEIGVNKTVGDKTFNNVIHIQIDLQYDYGTGFQSAMLYDYYVAKGVGMIEQDSKVGGNDFNKQTLVSYTIK